jgi:hypothetical protein
MLGDNKSPTQIWQMNNHGMHYAIAGTLRQALKDSRFAALLRLFSAAGRARKAGYRLLDRWMGNGRWARVDIN